MLKQTLHNKKLGAIFTVLLAFLFIFLLFNRHILDANQVSFASGGDGLKSTFGTLYHIQYDSSYWHFQGMNYPYGESVFFTGNQTFLTNILKLFYDSGWDISNKVLGILNLWLLFSFVLCALFLYLILVELKLPVWYSLIGAILITFLSPQWDRLSGHYNLAYAWVIPVAVYLIIRFYKKPSYVISVLFGIFIIAVAGKQLYFVVLTGTVWIIFWVFLLFRSKQLYGKSFFLIPHFFIQMIIPFLVFSIFAGSYDASADRTAFPWGFFPSTTRVEGVFLPLMKPYGRWIIIGSVKTLGYVGIISTIVFLTMIAIFFKKWLRNGFSNACLISDKFILNVLFLGGILTLLISLGFPFTLGFHDLLKYTGPFRQFRAIGRFIIPFYYLMNIYTFWFLWKWYTESGKKRAASILSLALLIIGFEAWFTVYDKPEKYYNKFPVFNDRANSLPQNQWVSNHDWSEYQAIMPLPYYHIGSENYWVNGNSPVIDHSYFASLKTGLPLNSVMLSRTSISQTLMNLDLALEFHGSYPVLELYQTGKAILLLEFRNSDKTRPEQSLINRSVLIDSNSILYFYRLPLDSLGTDRHLDELADISENLIPEGQDSTFWSVYQCFDSLPGGVLSKDITTPGTICKHQLPDSGTYVVSFWFEGAETDLWPRTQLIVRLADSLNQTKLYHLTDFFREVVLRKGNHALIEFEITSAGARQFLELGYNNSLLVKGSLQVDNILIRKKGSNIISMGPEFCRINNRLLKLPN